MESRAACGIVNQVIKINWALQLHYKKSHGAVIQETFNYDKSLMDDRHDTLLVQNLCTYTQTSMLLLDL